jgi:ketosteroid isomerase-like protein
MDPEYTEKLLATTRPVSATDDLQGVLHATYDAIIRGDFDALGQSMADDVELNIHGFSPINGTWRGRIEVVEATRKNFEQLESQQPTIQGMISQGDSIAVLMRESGIVKSTRKTYTIRGVQWFTFAAGKIKKIELVACNLLD